MMLLMLERVPRGLRGELTRWLLEPRANIFIGSVSAMVREKLWEMACLEAAGGSVFLVYTTNNEQGFTWRIWGEPGYIPEDFEGLLLVRRPNRKAAEDDETA